MFHEVYVTEANSRFGLGEGGCGISTEPAFGEKTTDNRSGNSCVEMFRTIEEFVESIVDCSGRAERFLVRRRIGPTGMDGFFNR